VQRRHRGEPTAPSDRHRLHRPRLTLAETRTSNRSTAGSATSCSPSSSSTHSWKLRSSPRTGGSTTTPPAQQPRAASASHYAVAVAYAGVPSHCARPWCRSCREADAADDCCECSEWFGGCCTRHRPRHPSSASARPTACSSRPAPSGSHRTIRPLHSPQLLREQPTPFPEAADLLGVPQAHLDGLLWRGHCFAPSPTGHQGVRLLSAASVYRRVTQWR
jgi:hypothetical protein